MKTIIFERHGYKEGLIRYVFVGNKFIEFMENKGNLEVTEILRKGLKKEDTVTIDLDELVRTREGQHFFRFQRYIEDLRKNKALISFHCWECDKDYEGNKLKSEYYTTKRKVVMPGCEYGGINFFCPHGHCVESVLTSRYYTVPKKIVEQTESQPKKNVKK